MNTNKKNYTKGASSVLKMILIASFLPILLVVITIYKSGLDASGFSSALSIIATTIPVILAPTFTLYFVKTFSAGHSASLTIFLGIFIFLFSLILFSFLLKMFFPIEEIGEAMLGFIVLLITLFLSKKLHNQNKNLQIEG